MKKYTECFVAFLDILGFKNYIERAECQEISEELEIKHTNYDKFVSIKDDIEFGTLVFCGTELAVEDAGVIIVDVKVKV